MVGEDRLCVSYLNDTSLNRKCSDPVALSVSKHSFALCAKRRESCSVCVCVACARVDCSSLAGMCVAVAFAGQRDWVPASILEEALHTQRKCGVTPRRSLRSAGEGCVCGVEGEGCGKGVEGEGCGKGVVSEEVSGGGAWQRCGEDVRVAKVGRAVCGSCGDEECVAGTEAGNVLQGLV